MPPTYFELDASILMYLIRWITVLSGTAESPPCTRGRHHARHHRHTRRSRRGSALPGPRHGTAVADLAERRGRRRPQHRPRRPSHRLLHRGHLRPPGTVPQPPRRPGCGATLAEHADDVQRLLASLTDTPALMLGCSLGAVIGMHVAVRYPGRIRTLIAHEPVAPRLLPDGERAHHERELAALQELYLREGLAAALPEIARTLGIDPASTDREPDLTPQPMNALRLANFDHFIRHDFTAVLHDTLDTTALKDTGTRIVPAVGRTTPHTVFDHRAATVLAELLGREPRFLPGGHNGNTTHPGPTPHSSGRSSAVRTGRGSADGRASDARQQGPLPSTQERPTPQ
ncbi:alpha/beta hydrolase [Streptomyces scabiei]|uniref:alpha/beta hydrolase n=1 Tax=Streptomyces scabiei TaxID=1930 RepID=UPI003A8E3D3B